MMLPEAPTQENETVVEPIGFMTEEDWQRLELAMAIEAAFSNRG